MYMYIYIYIYTYVCIASQDLIKQHRPEARRSSTQLPHARTLVVFLPSRSSKASCVTELLPRSPESGNL